MQRLQRDNCLIKNIEDSGTIENLVKAPLAERWKEFFNLNFQINFLDSPSQSYILNYFDKKINLDLCKYFKINEEYEISCDLGKETQSLCNGLNYKTCSWYNYQFLVKKLSNELNPQELELFYKFWITGIGLRYTKKRIEEHLAKHLNENNIFSKDWFISADNLKDIYLKVPGADLESDLIKKYEAMLNNNSFDLVDKLEKLLRHYIKHFDISTPVPLKGAKEFRELVKTKDFDVILFNGVSLKPFDF
ncbi:MAG: hypothetical protein WC393_03490 [Candidatus Nanoarchaeia archaeon]|jgi:hypothetical protein